MIDKSKGVAVISLSVQDAADLKTLASKSELWHEFAAMWIKYAGPVNVNGIIEDYYYCDEKRLLDWYDWLLEDFEERLEDNDEATEIPQIIQGALRPKLEALIKEIENL